jgi:hypothetical protein
MAPCRSGVPRPPAARLARSGPISAILSLSSGGNVPSGSASDRPERKRHGRPTAAPGSLAARDLRDPEGQSGRRSDDADVCRAHAGGRIREREANDDHGAPEHERTDRERSRRRRQRGRGARRVSHGYDGHTAQYRAVLPSPREGEQNKHPRVENAHPLPAREGEHVPHPSTYSEPVTPVTRAARRTSAGAQ